MSLPIELRKVIKSFFKSKSEPIPRKSRVSDVKVLKTRIWVESILREGNLSLPEFEDLYYSENESTGTIIRWLKGRQVARPESVNKLAERFPESKNTYDLPVFDLLEKDITRNQINKLLKIYRCDEDKLFLYTTSIFIWDLPAVNQVDNYDGEFIYKENVDSLFNRGDVYGFIAILILLREAELDHNTIKHELYIKYAYKALPSFCKDKRFKYRWKEFYDALISIHINVYSSYRLVSPLTHIIQQQIYSKHHHTRRENRPRSLSDLRYKEPDDPYIEAKFFFNDPGFY